MRPEGAEALSGLLFSLVEGRALESWHREVLVIGLLKSLREGRSLDDAFGLSGPGKRALHVQALTARRNHHLALAAELIEPGATPWAKCTRLGEEIKRFSVAWNRTAELPSPPSSWPEWKKELWIAAKTGLELPQSVRQIRRLLASNAPFSCHTDPLIMASIHFQ